MLLPNLFPIKIADFEWRRVKRRTSVHFLCDLCPFVDWILVQVIFTKQDPIYQANCIAWWSKTTSNSTVDLQITKNKCNKVDMMIRGLTVKLKGATIGWIIITFLSHVLKSHNQVVAPRNADWNQHQNPLDLFLICILTLSSNFLFHMITGRELFVGLNCVCLHFRR